MSVVTTPQEYAETVRGQYEDFPYPYRDPNKEGQYFNWCDPQSLMGLSHSGWGGRRDLRRGARFLIAGCGTGDSTIAFAEELAGCDTEIVAIDLSSKSIEISKARAVRRKLSNITFHHMSILDLPTAGLGQFDVIECGGVLHHLPDPSAGLSALGSVLKDDGIMAIMVYAQYGRLSIYLVQELMRKLIAEGTPRDQRISIAREFLNFVPSGHWLTVNNSLIVPEMQWPDGSGIYDLFLHSVDRAYTVPQLYEWVEGCGLVLNEFFSEMTDDTLYAPESYTDSRLLHQIAGGKSLRERQAIAELMNGNIAKHYFYATKQPKTPAVFADDMIIDYPPLQTMFMEFREGFIKALEQRQLGDRVEGPVKAFPGMPHLFVTKRPHTIALMKAIDGKHTIGQIVEQVAAQAGASREDVRADLEKLYHEYRTRLVVCLRHPSVPAYRTGEEIMKRTERVLGIKR